VFFSVYAGLKSVEMHQKVKVIMQNTVTRFYGSRCIIVSKTFDGSGLA